MSRYRSHHCNSGQTLAELALILCLISLVGLGSLFVMRDSLNAGFSQMLVIQKPGGGGAP